MVTSIVAMSISILNMKLKYIKRQPVTFNKRKRITMRHILITLVLIVAGCAQETGSSVGGSPALARPVTSTTLPAGTPTTTTVPPPPTTTTVVPLSYACANHPLTGKTLSNDSPYSIKLNSDCTFVFQDQFHRNWGTWSPDPNPDHIQTVDNRTRYPITLGVAATYVCLPETGPQNCSNTGWTGNVHISVFTGDPTTGLSIE